MRFEGNAFCINLLINMSSGEVFNYTTLDNCQIIRYFTCKSAVIFIKIYVFFISYTMKINYPGFIHRVFPIITAEKFHPVFQIKKFGI
jgi:hypothetical protein